MSYTESSFMYTIVFALIGFGAGFASEFYINKSFLVFMVMSVIAVLLSGLAQYLAAVIFGGAELVQGIVTVLCRRHCPYRRWHFCIYRLETIKTKIKISQ